MEFGYLGRRPDAHGPVRGGVAAAKTLYRPMVGHATSTNATRRIRRRITRPVAYALTGALACLVAGCADAIEARFNKVYTPDDAPTISQDARAFHHQAFIADLHADSVMWDRDLLTRADFGHVDLPRLVEGNVALQVFQVVTKTPRKREAPAAAQLINPKATQCVGRANVNVTGWLQVAQMRPLATWFSLRARAYHQIERLKTFIDRTPDPADATAGAPALMLIETAEDLRSLISLREAGRPVVGALIGVEGAHWIGGSGVPVEQGVQNLFDAGVRMVAPTHRFNNALGASSEGCDQRAGLTADGRAFLAAAERRGMVLDLAHLTDRGISQATADRTEPVVISHTGVRDRCPKADVPGDCVYERNLRDDEIRDVARTGGVVGIGYWPQAVGRGMDAVAGAFHAAADALSVPAFAQEMRQARGSYDPMDHIALGSDFDGAVKTPFDVANLDMLTASLMQTVPPADVPAFDEAALRRIYGRNVCRVLADRLPPARSQPAAICPGL